MKRFDRMAALFLIVVGLASSAYSWFKLTLGTMAHPDSGFMPFLAGLIMAAFAAMWLYQSLGKDENPVPFWEKGAWLRPLLLVLLLIFYGVTMELIGYLLSTLLFSLGWQALIEREKWWKTLLISGLSTAGMWLLFTQLLHVAVPVGRWTHMP